MRTFFIFILGFILGAGVGFKILEGISTQLLLEAWDNSYQEFQQSYPGSAAQKALDSKFQEQKTILVKTIKDGVKEKLLNMFFLDKAIKKEPLIKAKELPNL